MKFLFIITSNPFSKDYATVMNLTKELLEEGEEVSFFLSGNGCYYLLRKDLQELSEKGVKIYYCSHSARERGIESPPPFAQSSSTYSLSSMLDEYDKVLNFN